MNEEDKFEVRYQEIHDGNTGVTITFGAHAGSDGQPRKGTRWMRIAVYPDNPMETGDTKASTVTFGPDGQALKIVPHVQALMDVTDAPPSDEVDKPTKRDKK